jgi:dienelactone hydrolase
MFVAAGAVQAQEYFPPPSGKGPAVVLLSGQAGPDRCRDQATAIASVGYTAVLIDGKEVAPRESDAPAKLKKFLAQAQTAPRVQPGKAIVVGFSMGGAGALVNAIQADDMVAAVAAFYPAITQLSDIPGVARQVRVPTLLLAGAKDDHYNCCRIESMHQYVAAAKGAGADIELVIYPEGKHGFNIRSSIDYREADAEDSWRRLQAFLARHLPLN